MGVKFTPLPYILEADRLKFISVRKQHGELKCPELHNAGRAGAAEPLCRLQGWTV